MIMDDEMTMDQLLPLIFINICYYSFSGYSPDHMLPLNRKIYRLNGIYPLNKSRIQMVFRIFDYWRKIHIIFY
jgi:hypothetical protein